MESSSLMSFAPLRMILLDEFAVLSPVALLLVSWNGEEFLSHPISNPAF